MSASERELFDAIDRATIARPADVSVRPARFVIALAPEQDPIAVTGRVTATLAPYGAAVEPLSPLSHDLLLITLRDRIFNGDSGAAFEAAHAIRRYFTTADAEPEIIHSVFPEPEPPAPGEPRIESVDNFPPGCWVDEEPQLAKRWAIEAMTVPQAWTFSEMRGRPSRGAGIIIAQPDTGVTNHPEFVGVARVPGYDFVAGDADPTDPLNYFGNPGHGTGTGSVVVSPEAGDVFGTAPRATHMSIRAIENVARISQVAVAQAIDFAVAHGAHVITMSLGGAPSFSLWRALKRAVEADVVVLAAAGNCVELVVWPARYEDCIAVAGTNARRPALEGIVPGTRRRDLGARPERLSCGHQPGSGRQRRPRAGHQLRGCAERGSRRLLARPSWSRKHRFAGASAPRDRAGHVPSPAARDRAASGIGVGYFQHGGWHRRRAATARSAFRPRPRAGIRARPRSCRAIRPSRSSAWWRRLPVAPPRRRRSNGRRSDRSWR